MEKVCHSIFTPLFLYLPPFQLFMGSTNVAEVKIVAMEEKVVDVEKERSEAKI